MSWECGCGVVNRDLNVMCRACQTSKGMVWTPHGFKPADESVDLSDGPRRKQDYGYGWFCVIGGVIGFLIGVSTQNLALVLVMGFLTSAAALGRPWGWFVLLGSHVILTLFLFTVVIDAAARGDWMWVKLSALPLLLILPSFIFFYNGRVMFGLEVGEETPTERKVSRSGLLGALGLWGVIVVLGLGVSIPSRMDLRTRGKVSHLIGSLEDYKKQLGTYPDNLERVGEIGFCSDGKSAMGYRTSNEKTEFTLSCFGRGTFIISELVWEVYSSKSKEWRTISD